MSLCPNLHNTPSLCILINHRNMKMGRNDLFSYAVVAFALVLLNECNAAGLDTLYLGASLTRNQTMMSRNGSFEFGFFRPTGTDNWYLGTWSLPRKRVVWVANRETPARRKTGVLRLSRDGYLTLFGKKGAFLWSANGNKAASKAVILDSGNFVLLAANMNKSETIWESFDHPGNTWLPGMKFGKDKKLVSWKNSLDPAPGNFSFQVDPSRDKQLVLLSNSKVEYWSVEWDDNRISDITPFFNVKLKIENSSSGFYLTYRPTVDHFLGFTLRTYGVVGEDYYYENYTVELEAPNSACTVYNLCGPYGICGGGDDPCMCLQGWKPRDQAAWDLQEWWNSGCVFEGPSDCVSRNGLDDWFSLEYNILVRRADTVDDPDPDMTREACEELCLRNCFCFAYSYDPCQIWSNTDDLLDPLVATKDKLQLRVPHGSAASSSSQYKVTNLRIVLLLTIASIGALSIFVVCIIKTWHWRRRRLRSSTQRCADSTEYAFLRMFSYKELKTATRNFRCTLGTGGFGSVFKGTLIDGTHVAVKKLKASKQCEKQFRTEINSVGIIHHVNLVRLRGFCAQGSRRLLVYDYMSNGSLNSFLFTNSPARVLDWGMRFEIALGTARGLLYLHEKSRDRIIHSDIKPENILLDEDFTPKLGDFGLAKLVGRDFSKVLTTTRGTRGYLAPEWISGLPITSKVDVYSYGMTLLEIMSGRRNLDLTVQESSRYYLPAWAEEQICQGNMMHIVDKRIANNVKVEEVRRAALVSLLCIQNDENVRPDMAQVVLMLEGKAEAQTPQISQRLDRGNTDSDCESDSIV